MATEVEQLTATHSNGRFAIAFNSKQKESEWKVK